MKQQQISDECWKLYRIHRLAIATIIRYGKSRLARTTAEKVIEHLRTIEAPIDADRQFEWEKKGGESVIGIWPSHWSAGSGWPPAFYEIKPMPADGDAEKIRVGCTFPGTKGQRVEKRFKELAMVRGVDSSIPRSRVILESRNLEDLDGR